MKSYNKKKYILVCQATRYLLIDVINEFANNGCDILLITGEIRKANIPLNPAVKVKMLIRYDNSTKFKRLYTWIIFTLQSFFLILFKSKKNEVLYVTTPPFLVFLGLILKKIFNQKYHLFIWDLYPDVLVSLGVIKKERIVNKIWTRLNKSIFKNANNVFTISDNMSKAIYKYCNLNNIKVISNWVDSSFIKPINKYENSFAINHKQTDKLTIMYSGNLGETHDVESIVEAAKILADNENINFLIIGEGAKKKKIEKMVENYKLNNIKLLPFQDSAILPFSLSTADIGVVTLGEGAENVSVPSKMYYMMAAGSVILALANKDSELGRLIYKYNNGIVVYPGEINAIITFINEMYKNKILLNTYKKNSRTASFDFTPENAKLYYHYITNKENYNV